MSTKVATLYETNYRDAPATLRVIANEIEAGEHGDVLGIAIVMLGKKDGEQGLSVFGLGPRSDDLQTTGLLAAGQCYMTHGALQG